MKKFVFWSVLNKHTNIALTENMTRYSSGETFWKALRNLCETMGEWIPSASNEESDVNTRLRMYMETGINKVEIFVEPDGKRFAVKCANSRSFIPAASEIEAVMKYVERRANTSNVNTGEID